MPSAFPNALPEYDPFTTPITLQAFQHTARHRQMEEDIVALATKVGEDGSADPNSFDYLIAQLEIDKIARDEDDASGFDFVLDEDDLVSDSDTKLPTQQSVKAYIDAAIAQAKEDQYPVGSIYVNASDNTNPADLLGFGTWSAFGAGRVMVSHDAGQTEFDTAEETGGSKTHTLTAAEMPAHVHTGGNLSVKNDNPGDGNFVHGGTDASGTAGTVTIPTTASAGSDGAHNNLQPYIVVYMWKRTA